MSLSSLKCAVRHLIAMALIVAFPGSMWAQDAQTTPSPRSGSPQASLPQAPAPHQRSEIQNYSKPRGHFPNPLAPYTARQLASPDLTNSPKIDQLMRDGKTYLSLDDAVA